METMEIKEAVDKNLLAEQLDCIMTSKYVCIHNVLENEIYDKCVVLQSLFLLKVIQVKVPIGPHETIFLKFLYSRDRQR